MFIVFNKQKIISYLVALSTVVVLFVMAVVITNQTGENVISTAATPKELPIYNVATQEKKVALTMNCAWNADDIDKILEVLQKHNAQITFFMVGDWVDKFPEAVKKIAKANQEIGNHSNTHPHVNNLNLEENVEEIKKCNEKIEKITGKAPTLYRGPYGEYNDTVIKAAKSQSMQTIQWNLDSLDYQKLTEEQMWQRIGPNLASGSIILMHNGTEHTADSLDGLLTKMEQKGYKITTVSDLIYKQNYTINQNGTQVRSDSME